MENNKRTIASSVGYMAAGASVLGSFQKSLLPRTPADQGIITGLTMALSFTVATVIQDAIESNVHIGDDNDSEVTGLAISGGAFVAGAAVQMLFGQKEDEKAIRSFARTAGYWLSVVGIAGGVIHGLTALADTDKKEDYEISQALVLPIGVLVALLFDVVRHKKVTLLKDSYLLNSPLRVALISGSVLGVLTATSLLERRLAYRTQKVSQQVRKAEYANSWLPSWARGKSGCASWWYCLRNVKALSKDRIRPRFY
jgi:uncharacterized membrane protein